MAQPADADKRLGRLLRTQGTSAIAELPSQVRLGAN
jgi:hypothetical protein